MNPIDNSRLDLSKSNSFKNNESLHDGLKKTHYFALRFGELRLANKDKPWCQWRVKDNKIPSFTEFEGGL